MECVQLSDRPLCCRFYAVARSMKIHDQHVVDNGTLLREEDGVITATGRLNDQHTLFKVYKYTYDKKLAYKIQSIVDEKFLAIDIETGELIIKRNSDTADRSTLFWAQRINSVYKVLHSVVGMKPYIHVDTSGAVNTTVIPDEEDLKKDLNVWFRVEQVDD